MYSRSIVSSMEVHNGVISNIVTSKNTTFLPLLFTQLGDSIFESSQADKDIEWMSRLAEKPGSKPTTDADLSKRKQDEMIMTGDYDPIYENVCLSKNVYNILVRNKKLNIELEQKFLYMNEIFSAASKLQPKALEISKKGISYLKSKEGIRSFLERLQNEKILKNEKVISPTEWNIFNNSPMVKNISKNSLKRIMKSCKEKRRKVLRSKRLRKARNLKKLKILKKLELETEKSLEKSTNNNTDTKSPNENIQEDHITFSGEKDSHSFSSVLTNNLKSDKEDLEYGVKEGKLASLERLKQFPTLPKKINPHITSETFENININYNPNAEHKLSKNQDIQLQPIDLEDLDRFVWKLEDWLESSEDYFFDMNPFNMSFENENKYN